MQPPVLDSPRRAPAPLALFAVVAAVATGGLALASSGFLWQDEYAHLLFSRWFWRHPEVAVDLWGRPLATLAYAPAAVAGLWAARICTVVLASLAAWWTAAAARRHGTSERVAWAAVLAQPFFFAFSFGALPGTLFAALLARFLLEESAGRYRRAAALVALLPLARVEGVLVVLVYAVVLARRGRRVDALLTVAGIAAWNVAGFAVTGEPLFLLTNNPYPVVGSIYPTAGWPFLARALPAAAGAVVFLLAQAGIASRARRPDVRHAIALVVAVFLTLVWGVPMFASTPTPVYLIGFAPLLALFAADGWAWLRARPSRAAVLGAVAVAEALVFVPRATLDVPSRWLGAPVGGSQRIALALGFALAALGLLAGSRFPKLLAPGLLLAGIAGLGGVALPVAPDAHQVAAREAGAWARAEIPERPLVAVAPDVMWFAGADPFVAWEPGSLPGPDAVRRLPADAVLAWDREYAVREGRLELDALHAEGWRELHVVAHPGAEIRFLSRTP